MAKGRKKPPKPAMQSLNLAKPQFYYHSPSVDDHFLNADALHSPGPAIGLPMHQDPALFDWVQQHGVAPDVLFRQGLAAPPLPGNESGLRHYVAQMDVDPQRIVNLDLPLEAQTADVRRALEKMGIRTSDSLLGEPMPVANAMWENALANSPEVLDGPVPYFRDSKDLELRENLARGMAQGAVDGNLPVIRDVAANTMYQQLDEAGLPMGVTKGTGYQAGAAYAPKRVPLNADGYKVPTVMGQEARIFQPSKLEIIRRLAVPGAIGVGAAAAAGSASADDRYGDRTSRFSDPSAPPEPTFDDRAGVRPQDTLTSRSYKRAGQYLADRGNEFGEFVSKKAGELADYVSKRAGTDLDPGEMDDFQANLPREHRQFAFAVDEEMQKPVVRVPGATVTPAFFLEKAAAHLNLSELSVENAVASIKGLPFDKSDNGAMRLRDELLNQMRLNLPGRYENGAIDTEFDAGATPEQAAEFDRDGVLEGRYRLTPEGEAGYQSERAYNLFATFQNGTHRPVWSDRPSKGLALAGAVIQKAAGDHSGGDQTARLAGYRKNTPAGRMNESLYWYNRGQPDGTSGDSRTGADYPSLSSTTFEGVTAKMTNADNFLPRYNQQLSERYLYNLDMPAANRAILDRMRDDFYRTTPRYPAGADPKEVRGLIRELKDLDTEARQYASVEYPSFVRKYSFSPEAFGGAPTDFTGRTVYPDKPLTPVKPTYLSPFGEMMANYPRDLMDMQTIGELGLAGVTGGTSLLGSLVNEKSLARGGAKAAKMMARQGLEVGSEAVKEVPTNWAIAEVNRPAESPGFFTPPQYHPLVTDFQGNPVAADDPNYELYKPSAYQKREDRLRRILDAGTKMYGRTAATPSPAIRSVQPVMQ